LANVTCKIDIHLYIAAGSESLSDDVAKSGVHATHIRSENKATCSSLSAEYDQIFGQPEKKPKFGLATTASQA
jgi:hypothetical protein